MAKTKTDSKTLELIKEVNRQKAEISSAEKPQWKTNLSFSYVGGSAQIVNILVEKNISQLLSIAAFLTSLERTYAELATEMGVDNPPPFSWNGFSASDWIHDIKVRINKVQIESKRAKLASLETRLNSIISPELRAQMELEAIQNELAM